MPPLMGPWRAGPGRPRSRTPRPGGLPFREAGTCNLPSRPPSGVVDAPARHRTPVAAPRDAPDHPGMTMHLIAAGVLAALPLASMPAAADEATAMAAAGRHVAAQEAAIVGELRELLALPNVATSATDIRANADLLVRMLGKRGIAARILETPGAPVAVYGERRAPGARRTLLFYAHFEIGRASGREGVEGTSDGSFG